MSALGTRVTTTTQSHIMPKLVDTILNSNVFASKMLMKASKFNGERMKFPVKYAKNTTGGSFAGFTTFSTSATDNRVNVEFVPKFYHMTVALPLDELSANATEEKVLDLATIEVASTAQDMADDIGTLFYGVGSNGVDFLGLEGIVDDSTNLATYGTLSRTTYTTLRSTVTASAGVLSLAKMSTLYNAASSGSQTPTLGLCSETIFALYEQLLQPQERIMKTVSMYSQRGNHSMGAPGGDLVGGTGFTGLYFKGFPVLADEKATSGVLYFINEDFMDFFALPMALQKPIQYKAQIDGNDYSNVTGLGFSWSDWIRPTNSASIVGHVYLGGELISANPKRHAKLTAITTV